MMKQGELTRSNVPETFPALKLKSASYLFWVALAVAVLICGKSAQATTTYRPDTYAAEPFNSDKRSDFANPSGRYLWTASNLYNNGGTNTNDFLYLTLANSNPAGAGQIRATIGGVTSASNRVGVVAKYRATANGSDGIIGYVILSSTSLNCNIDTWNGSTGSRTNVVSNSNCTFAAGDTLTLVVSGIGTGQTVTLYRNNTTQLVQWTNANTTNYTGTAWGLYHANGSGGGSSKQGTWDDVEVADYPGGFGPPPAKTWNGAGANANVSNGTNWAGGVAPGAGDPVVFPSGTKAATWDASATANVYSVTINSGYVNDVTLARSLTVITDVTVNAGSLSLNGQTLTVQGGDITGAGRIYCGNGNDTCGGGQVYLEGAGNLGNSSSAGYTFYQLDLSGANQTTTFQGPITVKGDFYCGQDPAVPNAHTCDTNNSSNYALTVNGNFYVFGLSGSNAVFNANGSTVTVAGQLIIGSPWDGNNDGTFNAGSSTVILSGTNVAGELIYNGAGNAFNAGTGTVRYTNGGGSVPVTATSITYNTLEFAGSGTYVLGTGASQTLMTANFTLTQGTVTAATYNPAINISGNVSLSLGTTYFMGSGTTTLSGSSKTITDSNATTQDLGPVSITGTYLLSSSARMQSLAGAGTLTLNSNTLTLTGSGTPLTGGVTLSSGSTVEFASGSGATVPIKTYHHLKINGSGNFSTSSGTTTVNGNLDIASGTLSAGVNSLSLLGNLTIGSSGAYSGISSTFTFSGTSPATWTDSSSGGPTRLGNVTCNKTNGTTSQNKVTLASNVAASSVTVGGANSEADADTLKLDTYTLRLHNNGTSLIVRTGATLDVTTVPGSTVAFVGTTGTTIPALTYHHLAITPGFDGATHTFAAGTTTVNGNLTVGNGTNTGTIADGAANSPTLTVGGDVTIQTSATLSGNASHSISVGGSWTNAGTFTSNFGDVTFNGTASGKTINAGSSSFYSLTFNGVGGVWSPLTNTLIVALNLTMTAGTLDNSNGSADVRVSGWVNGTNGVINLTTNTFEQRLAANKAFGTTSGSVDWTFKNLTFSSSAGTPTATTNTGGTGVITVTNVLTIGANTTLDAGNRIWILTGTGTPFVKTGTFTYNTSEVRYMPAAAVATTVTGGNYYYLTIWTTVDMTSVPLTLGGNVTANAPSGTFGLIVKGNFGAPAALDTTANNYSISIPNAGLLLGVWGFGSYGSLNARGSTITIGDLLDVSGGTFTQGTSQTTVSGNFLIDVTGVFTKDLGGTGTLTLNGASKTWTDNTSGQDVGKVIIDGSIAAATAVKAGTLTINAAKSFSLNGKDVSLTNGSITGTGRIYCGNGDDTCSAGTVSVLGDGTVGGGTFTFFGLTLYGAGSTTTFGGPITTNGILWCGGNTAHTCTTNNYTLTSNSQFQVFGASGGGANNAVFNAGSSTITVGGPFLTYSIFDSSYQGTFNANTSTLTTTNTSGTPFWFGAGIFNAGTGTVTLTGNNPAGDTALSAVTFNNLIFNAAGETFNATGTTTATGTITAQAGTFEVGTRTVTGANVAISGGTLSMTGSGGKLKISGGGTLSMSSGVITVADMATPVELTTSDAGTPTYVSVNLTGGTLNVAELSVDYLKSDQVSGSNYAGFRIGSGVTVTAFNKVTFGSNFQTTANADALLDVTAQTVNLLNDVFPASWSGECNVRANTSGTVTMWDWSGGFGGENNDCDNGGEVIWKGGSGSAPQGSGAVGAPLIY